VHLTAAKDMEMEVKDGLAGIGTVVEDQTVAVANAKFRGNLGRRAQHLADQLFIFGLDECRADDMFFGDDQKMDGRLGGDIAEGEHRIVFIEFVGGDLTGDDLTEKAVFVHLFSLVLFSSL
jgi:hypothetical protein